MKANNRKRLGWCLFFFTDRQRDLAVDSSVDLTPDESIPVCKIRLTKIAPDPRLLDWHTMTIVVPSEPIICETIPETGPEDQMRENKATADDAWGIDLRENCVSCGFLSISLPNRSGSIRKSGDKPEMSSPGRSLENPVATTAARTL